jgi:bla regulator protein blaR1
MIANYLSAVVPALADHLWQSTLFALAAGLLTLTLRKNRAGARYWLWLAASLKFLVPFSLLSSLGGRLAFLSSPVAPSQGLAFAVEIVSQPFTTQSPITRPGIPVPASPNAWIPLLFALWLCGFLAVLIVWYTRWREISAAIRESEPLREGREFEALHRVETNAAARIEMLLSRASLEPGIFGIVRPVMIWPEGISSHLEDAHLEAILIHELWHVRRRDNLAAAIHMLVEAVFWFHPLIWWLGSRLVEERERACDEEVLELGGERQVYAESILKVCEFCLGSPLACVAGVTGADLKKRMVNIMTTNGVRKLDFSRKLLLSVAGLLAVALPLGFGLMHAPRSHAESLPANSVSAYSYRATSLKPSKIMANGVIQQKMMFMPEGISVIGVTPGELIREAYQLGDNQLAGAPEWVDNTRYDIEATLDKSVAGELKKLGPEQLFVLTRRMRQQLVVDLFRLQLHPESKDLERYTLSLADGGPKLHEVKSEQNGPGLHGMMRSGPGELTGQALHMAEIVNLLSRQVGSTVIDQTGLKGAYDVTLRWTPGEHELPQDRAGHLFPPDAEKKIFAPGNRGPALVTALEEQLGLELKSTVGPVQILAIDHAERPVEN